MKPATVIDRDAPYRDAFIPDNASRLWRYQVCAARALGVMALTTLVCWFMRPWLTPEACCMVFLGVTVSLGAIMAPPTPLFLALFGLLAWNYFFTPPDFDLRIRTTDELVHHLLFFVIALVMNGLTARLRVRERESKRRELRANLLRECREALVRENVAGFLRLIGNFVGGEARLETAPAPAARDDTLVTPLFAGGANLGALQIVFPQKPTPTEEGTWLLAELASQAALYLVYLEHLRLAAEAEKARETALSERLGRALLDNVTHEVKTPVSIILASLHRLKLSGADERTRDSIEAMTEAAQRMVRVTDELTLMSSVRSRMLRPSPEFCDAGELVTESLAACLPREAESRVRVSTTPSGACVKTDPHLFGTILSNFVSNALRHSPAGAPVEVAVNADASRVRILVRDRGPGVSESDMPRVFDRFYRGSNPGSLGLGLAISRELAEILGATVEVANAPEGGAVFSVSFPRVSVERPPEFPVS